MIDEKLKMHLLKNKDLIDNNDFESLLKPLQIDDRNYLFSFLYDDCKIDILQYMNTIYPYMFEYCDTIDNLIIPSNITNFQVQAFSNCHANRIEIAGKVNDCGKCIFSICDAQEIKLSRDFAYLYRPAIYFKMFYKCNNLRLLYVPKEIKDDPDFDYDTFIESAKIDKKFVKVIFY